MKLNFLTKVLLVLLQLSIGWHLFYEGVWKFQNPSWSSKGYLHNASGPAGLTLRWLAGDPDVVSSNGRLQEADPTPDLVARLTPQPFDPARTPHNLWHNYLPEPIKQQWEAYFQTFVQHYKLEPEPARRDFEEMENEMTEWLVEGTKGVKRPNFNGPAAEVATPIPQRLKEYLTWHKAEQALAGEEDGTFHIKGAPRARKAHDEANAIRTELASALDSQYDLMKKKLRDLLTPEQRRMAPPPEPEAKSAAAGWEMLPRIDNAVKWALLVIGAGLLLGLFTRLSCVAGAVLLLLFYLAMPPFPVPAEGPEGHFLLINKNFIEMLALLTLATTQPGRRYGLDAWLGALGRALFGRKKTAEPKKVIPAPEPAAVPAPPAPEVAVPASTPAYPPTNRS
jgi:uncharacterized membrane protein YphA (DoxX/SURF4 family)